MGKTPPFSLLGAKKREVRTQFAALCYRLRQGKVQVLVITSRRSKRWIMPKGWPMDGKTPGASAAREAWEEAGVRGRVSEVSVGTYSYAKMRDGKEDLTCLAILFPLQVTSVEQKYPERKQRSRRWVSRKKAARLVGQPDLAKLILGFEPRPQRQKT